MAYVCRHLPATTPPATVQAHLEEAEKHGWELVTMTYVPGTAAGDVILYAFHSPTGAHLQGLGNFHSDYK
jgi:hypothetical protein